MLTVFHNFKMSNMHVSKWKSSFIHHSSGWWNPVSWQRKKTELSEVNPSLAKCVVAWIIMFCQHSKDEPPLHTSHYIIPWQMTGCGCWCLLMRLRGLVHTAYPVYIYCTTDSTVPFSDVTTISILARHYLHSRYYCCTTVELNELQLFRFLFFFLKYIFHKVDLAIALMWGVWSRGN